LEEQVMEFRKLSTETELSIFMARLEKARTKNAAFRENRELQALNRQRLESSRLYGLFESEIAPADTMVAGIAMHDLKSFPQSCSEPDLSHFPAQTVVECSDHWSLSNGTGMFAWAGLAVPMRLAGIKAILAYLAADKTVAEHAGFYALMGFVPAGPIVQHPFVEHASGEKFPVLPVLLQGEAFENVVNAFSKACLGYSEDGRVFHLKNGIRHLVRSASTRCTPFYPHRPARAFQRAA
jgi:hypothetical protein